MKVWVTRDRDGIICAWNTNRGLEIGDDGMWDTAESKTDIVEGYDEMDPRNFKKLFGFTPRKGSCKQYELELKEIK
jgi:hypothetical protein